MTDAPRRAPRKAAPSATAVKKAAAKRAVPPGNDEFVGRLASLAAEARLAPYQVTANLSIEPPDKERASIIAATQTAYVIARNQLDGLISPLEDPDAEDGILRDEQGQPVLPTVDAKLLEQLRNVVEDAAQQYDKALFGDAYDAVVERFKTEQGVVWNAFYNDVTDYFLPTPKNGKCPTCGHVADADAEGNDDESSTSSSTTGTT